MRAGDDTRSGDHGERLGQAREHLPGALPDDDEVLDAHPQLHWQVDPRLDRHHAPGEQGLLAGRAREPGGLVDLHPHAVSEAVPEVLPVALPLYYRPSDGVEIAPARTRPDGGERLLLGGEDDLVDPPRP